MIEKTKITAEEAKSLPVGSIIRNYKGEYGVIDRGGKVIRVSEDFVRQIERDFPRGKVSTP